MILLELIACYVNIVIRYEKKKGKYWVGRGGGVFISNFFCVNSA